MTRTSARLTDIARQLNVSPSLVSRVLNNKPGSWASEKVRERILLAAREMNYTPNAAARTLGSGKSRTVALPFFAPEGDLGRHGMVVSTLALLLGQQGYHLLVDVAETRERSLALLASLASRRGCDAVILWGDEPTVEEQARLVLSLGLPFVAKGDYVREHPDWLQVEFDHVEMMRLAVNHLADRGHRRIAYLGHLPVHIYSRNLLVGFQAAYQTRFATPPSPDYLGGVYAETTPQEQFQSWLSLPANEAPTALVISTGEETAWQQLEILLMRTGRRIGYGPTDFAVTGLRHTASPLLFGEAEAFPDSELSYLTEVMCKQLILPLLEGTAPEHAVVRVHAPLQRVPSSGFPLATLADISQELSKDRPASGMTN